MGHCCHPFMYWQASVNNTLFTFIRIFLCLVLTEKMYYMIIGATCIINDTFKSQNDGRLEYLETFAVLKVSWKIKNLTFVYNVLMQWPVFRKQKVSFWGANGSFFYQFLELNRNWRSMTKLPTLESKCWGQLFQTLIKRCTLINIIHIMIIRIIKLQNLWS